MLYSGRVLNISSHRRTSTNGGSAGMCTVLGKYQSGHVTAANSAPFDYLGTSLNLGSSYSNDHSHQH
jgi:hypothetical protein